MKVRLFGDWDKTSKQMVQQLQRQTIDMIPNKYLDMEFVYDDTYDHAVVFNYPLQTLRTPPEKNIGLVLEPPEIVNLHYKGRSPDQYPQIGRYFSFAEHEGYEWAPGVGFATTSTDDFVEFEDKTKNVCMIASNKRLTPWHHRRHEVLQALLNTDLEIDFYGRGLEGSDPRIKGTIPPFKKQNVLKDYRFCIDFENSSHKVLTDKFYDPVLCGTVPITNANWLPEIGIDRGYVAVDFDSSIDEIVKTISDVISVPSSLQGAIFKKGVQVAFWDVASLDLNLTYWIYRTLKEL